LSRLFEVIYKNRISTYKNNDLPLIIGSGKDAHIHISSWKKTAAYIADSRGHLFLQKEDNTVPLYHNDKHITSSVWIKSGDRTRIGDEIILYHISGDMVQIRVLPISQASGAFSPKADIKTSLTPEKDAPSLPRVNNVPDRYGSRYKGIYWLLGTIFFMLVTTAIFLLMAHSVKIEIRPVPDTVSITGFPPAAKIGSHILCLPGHYTVKAWKDGYRPLSMKIRVQGNTSNKFSFTMQKLPGLLDITTVPVTGATVYIDGKPTGTTPLKGMRTSAGKHSLTVFKKHYTKVTKNIYVDGMGKEQHFVITLKPGWKPVSIDSEPEGATVLEGEKPLGKTPVTLELMEGRHHIVFKKKNFSDQALDLNITDGHIKKHYKIVMKPAPAILNVISSPAGAMVTLDDVFKGITPLTIPVTPSNKHIVHVTIPGYREETKKIHLVSASRKTLSIKLRPEYGIIFLTTHPANARLFVDSHPHGLATGRLVLTARKHTLTIQAPGYETMSTDILPHKGYSQQLDIHLRPKGSAVTTYRRKNIRHNETGMIMLGPAIFQMGASRREPGRRANEQEYTVRLARPFLLSDHEVTNEEFRRFMPAHHSGTFKDKTLDMDKQPVINITWKEAALYCNWLSRRENLPLFYKRKGNILAATEPCNTGYRLPTEAEWAYAARMAGKKTRARYPWAGSFPPKEVCENYADESAKEILPSIINGYNDGYSVTAPVQSFKKNSAGIYDMGGNVSEWCHDFYTPYKIIPAGKPLVDPMGPKTGTHHVIRGGNWQDAGITEIRLSYRGYGRTAKNNTGFRIARYVR